MVTGFPLKYKLKKSIEHLLKSDLTLSENERNPIFIASEKNLLALKPDVTVPPFKQL